MTEAEIRAAHPDWTDEQVKAELAKEPPAAAVPDLAKPAETETVTIPKAEADALRRKAAEAERRANKLEADQKKAEEDRQAKQGEYQQLAEQRQRELEQERAERARIEREARISRLASKAKFLDPADVIGRITAEEGADDASTEAALARIAEQSPHLVAKEAAAKPEIGQVHEPAPANAAAAAGTADGKPAPPAGKSPLQSLDEWEALPQTERQARMAEADWLFLQEK